VPHFIFVTLSVDIIRQFLTVKFKIKLLFESNKDRHAITLEASRVAANSVRYFKSIIIWRNVLVCIHNVL